MAKREALTADTKSARPQLEDDLREVCSIESIVPYFIDHARDALECSRTWREQGDVQGAEEYIDHALSFISRADAGWYMRDDYDQSAKSDGTGYWLGRKRLISFRHKNGRYYCRWGNKFPARPIKADGPVPKHCVGTDVLQMGNATLRKVKRLIKVVQNAGNTPKTIKPLVRANALEYLYALRDLTNALGQAIDQIPCRLR